MIYTLIRKILFALEAETAHKLGLFGLDFLNKAGIACLLGKIPEKNPVTVMGITFPNPVGLAAGMDKDGRYIDALAALGFGFIEIGTVTPTAHEGNPKPRLFRFIKEEALVSRMGLNSAGIEDVVKNLANSRFTKLGGILGINICKNNQTAPADAVEDYLICMEQLYPYASYLAVNAIWINGLSFSEAEQKTYFEMLFKALKEAQAKQQIKHNRYVPLVVKVSADLDDAMIESIADLLRTYQMDGLLTTSATFNRDEIKNKESFTEKGVLSGKPLFEKARRVQNKFAEHLSGSIPIIASGGILSGEDAAIRTSEGASLIELYTGFIYKGPQLVSETAAQIMAQKESSIHE